MAYSDKEFYKQLVIEILHQKFKAVWAEKKELVF